MINRYAWWQYLIIVLVVIVSLLYALPNVYGTDPSVQVSSKRVTLNEPELRAILETPRLLPKKIEPIPNGFLLRYTDTEVQLKAMEALNTALSEKYQNQVAVALNLVSAAPSWFATLGALPMYLGLDLRGGVHFQLAVDMDTALKRTDERYINDIRALLRTEKLRAVSVTRLPGGGVEARFSAAEERNQALAKIKTEFPELELLDKEAEGVFIVTAKLTDIALNEERKKAVKQNITSLRNRVNGLGVSEPIIQQQGQDRIVVQLPGVQDPVIARETLGATATLEFRLVDEESNVQDAVAGRVPPGSVLYRERNGQPILLKNRVIVSGDRITDASSSLDAQTSTPVVSISLDGKGGQAMSATTKENVNKLMAVVYIESHVETKNVNGQVQRTRKEVQEVINVARIREAFGKRFQISGLDNPEEARTLALLLRAGSLAAPMDIVEERTIGPSLGKENIEKGLYACVVSFIVTVIFMGLYYRVFGIAANIALLLNVVIIVAAMSIFQFTLTLPGIAGIVLTMGMAVDANVLIYERIREELRTGNTPQAAIHAGFEKAWGTIADSNVTTLIAALALFLFGTGPVKGFAVTLSIGITASMFTAVMVTRAIINLSYGGRKVERLAV